MWKLCYFFRTKNKEKICTQCSVLKTLDKYYLKPNDKVTFRSECKECNIKML